MKNPFRNPKNQSQTEIEWLRQELSKAHDQIFALTGRLSEYEAVRRSASGTFLEDFSPAAQKYLGDPLGTGLVVAEWELDDAAN